MAGVSQSVPCYTLCVFFVVMCQFSAGVKSFNLIESLSNAVTKMADNTADLLDSKLQTKVVDASSYTEFCLFTSDSGENHTIVNIGDKDSLLKAGFSVSRPTKILIHGWKAIGVSDDLIVTLREALCSAEDLNVIVVDWNDVAEKSYGEAFTAVTYVGRYTASLVDFLVQDVGADIDSIHLIGFSLGAHIAGVVGESITCGKLPWITGLDPAGPLVTDTDTEDRLDESDAVFVDVIHTSMMGFQDPCGTVDFYPNGGDNLQPGCLLMPCAHGRAYKFYAESVSSNKFIATPCSCWKAYKKGKCAKNETTVMGYHVDKSLKGEFYLKTKSKSPYAKGA